MKFSDLKEVNEEINQREYVADVFEDWNPDQTDGWDCDNYATKKIVELIKRGWPKESLRLCFCYVKTVGHLVLLADLDGQTFVLDNRHPFPTEWQLCEYKIVKIWNWTLNDWEKVS